MHVLFVHPNYPAQFRCIAPALARDGWTCTFATRNAKAAELPGVPRVIYQPCGGATRATHFAARTFENTVGHAHGVYAAMQARRDVVPDLVVAHSGFGSSLFLPTGPRYAEAARRFADKYSKFRSAGSGAGDGGASRGASGRGQGAGRRGVFAG